MTKIRAGMLPRGQREMAIDRTLYPHYRKLEAGASMLPLQFAHGFVSYLGHYPYACTEQIVSQAMPAILLKARPEFGYVRTEPGADITGLVSELRARQNDVGAYKLWPGSDQVIEFVALYAQHFLLEAAERDEPVPGDIIASGNGFLRSVAARDGNNLTDERQTAYAIYLLTRQGQRMSTEIAAARKRLEERYRGQWEQDLTAAWLAASLDLMRQDRDAGQLIGRTRFGLGTTGDTYNDPMTRDALLLFVMARHFPEKLSDVPKETLGTLAQRVNDSYYHSLSAGATLLALDAYASATQGAARNLSLAEVLKDKRVRTLDARRGHVPEDRVQRAGGSVALHQQLRPERVLHDRGVGLRSQAADRGDPPGLRSAARIHGRERQAADEYRHGSAGRRAPEVPQYRPRLRVERGAGRSAAGRLRAGGADAGGADAVPRSEHGRAAE